MATVPDRKRSDPLPAAEHATLQAFLGKLGLTAAQIQAAVGTGAAGRTRLQVAQALSGWLKTRPKGG